MANDLRKLLKKHTQLHGRYSLRLYNKAIGNENPTNCHITFPFGFDLWE